MKANPMSQFGGFRTQPARGGLRLRLLAVITCGGAFQALMWAQIASTAPPQPPVSGSSQASQTISSSAPEPAYRIEGGDVVGIHFFYNEELNTKAQVRPDGKISLPLIGEAEIAGSTIEELTGRLTDQYKGKLREPAITIQIEGFANRRVFVGGEVTRPGVLALVGKQTLMGAIYEAGGMTRAAKRNEVTVFRRADTGGVQQFHLAVGKLGSRGSNPSPAMEFQLRPLDIVVVHESGIARANRFVDQYMRQMSPALLTAGFSYFFNGAVLP